MILFAADQHYGQHPGAVLCEQLAGDFDIAFTEDDWTPLRRLETAAVDLLILNLISGACDVPPPTAAELAAVRGYVESGGNLLLIHAGSAAFWQCDWWRPLVGFRWVRDDDPDGFAPSVHPHAPCRVEVAKTRHPLATRLRPMDLPEDEIYTGLEQTCAASILMHTVVDGATHVQCHENATPAGGRVIGFLPGHKPELVRHPDLVANVKTLLVDLL